MNGKTRIACLALLLGIVPAILSLAVEKEEPKPNGLAAGMIKSVDSDAKSFVLMVKDGDASKEITVKVDEKTKFTLDGKEALKEEALKAGAMARVSHKDNVAIMVDVKSKPA